MRGHLVALALLSALVVPAGGALSALPAANPSDSGSGSIGIKLIGEPGVTVDPFSRIYIVDRLAPGATLRREVEVSNTTQSIANVAVYQAGASITKGQFGFLPGTTADDLSSWTSVSRGLLHLPAGGEALETVTIRVPNDATSGERYAVIWAQVSAPAATGGGVTLVNRVGVRMYVSIGAGGAPAPDFAIGALVATRSTTGAPVISAEVSNKGADTLDISGTLTLTDGPGGISAGSFPVALGVALAPGGSEPATVQFNSGLPSGPWRANIRLASGSLDHAETATITFPGKAVAPRGGSHLLILIGSILLILILMTGAIFVLLRRRRRQPPQRHEGE